MALDAILPIHPGQATNTASFSSNTQAPGRAGPFDQHLVGELKDVDQQIKAADSSLRALAVGDDIPVHEVMLNIQRAKLSMEYVVEVRNRVLEAYQELMRMQI